MGFPYFYARMSGRRQYDHRIFHRFATINCLQGLGLLALRVSLVESAEAVGSDLTGWSRVMRLTLTGYFGQQGFDPISDFLVMSWPYILLTILLVFGLYTQREGNAGALFWLLATAVACIVGLTNDRSNLLLLSITFLALFMISAMSWLFESGWLARLAAGGLLAYAILGAAYISGVAMEAFHPYAANVVHWNAEFLIGRFADQTKVPEARRAATLARLAQVDIYSSDDFPSDYYEAYRDETRRDPFSVQVRAALNTETRRPDDRTLFVPWLEPFSP
jgi:hypothetical protein